MLRWGPHSPAVMATISIMRSTTEVTEITIAVVYVAPAPDYYYAPPTNYYDAPEPYYYPPVYSAPPPSEGINLFFGIH